MECITLGIYGYNKVIDQLIRSDSTNAITANYFLANNRLLKAGLDTWVKTGVHKKKGITTPLQNTTWYYKYYESCY